MDYQLGPGPLQVDQNTIDEKIKGDIGIVENGDVATHTIPNGYYVIWKGDLYVAKTDISSGTTLSAESNGNLTAKSNGLGGEVAALNSNYANIGVQFNVTPGDNVTITSQRNCSLKGNASQKLVSIMFTTSATINNGILFTGFFAVGAMNSIIPIYLVSATEVKIYSMRISGTGQANANGALPAGTYCANGVYI